MAGVEELNGPTAGPRVALARAVLEGAAGGTTMLSVVLRRVLLAAVICAFAPLARADEPPFVIVERTAGEPLRGRLLDLTGRTFRVLLADGSVVEVPEREVREVRFEAPRPASPPEHPYRPLHGAPTASLLTAPGSVSITANPSNRNEYVLASLELWRRTGDGPWAKRQELAPGAPGFFDDAPADPRAAYTYKVVSVGRVDEDDPVVQRYRLTLPEEQVRRESELLGPVTPGPRCHVVPAAVFGDGSALVVVHAWTGRPDATASAWWSRSFRVTPGAFVGDAIDGHDFRAGVRLEAARLETKPDGAARLVVRLRHADGRVEEVDDTRPLPDGIDVAPTPDRGVVLAAQKQPATRDRLAEVRAALASPRPLTLNFPLETPLRDVLPFLRKLTGIDIVVSPAVDLDKAGVRFTVRDVPQGEVLLLIAELTGLEARPWSGVLWLQERGAREPWVRSAVPGPAGELLERAHVHLELERFPLRDALDLLHGQTGLNIVVSAEAQEWIEDDQLTATLTARDLSLRDALTLIVDGTSKLRWHARGSVVQVLHESERSTREVAVERTLEALVTRDLDLLPATGNTIEAWDSAFGAWSDHFSGPPTVETVQRELEFKQQDGAWSLVTAAPPTKRAPGSAPRVAPWSILVEQPAMVLSLERRVAYTDERNTADVDLRVDASHPASIQVTSLGTLEEDPRPALAIVRDRAFEDVTTAPPVSWTEGALPREWLRAGTVFLVRTRKRQVFKVRIDRLGSDVVVLTIDGVEGGADDDAGTGQTPSPAVREAADLIAARDHAKAGAVLDRALAAAPGDVDARLLRAQLRLRRDDCEGATADAKAVLATIPDHALALTFAAYAHPEGEPARRLELCTAALQSDPTLVPALVLRADILTKLGRREDALHDVRRARKAAPGDFMVWVTSAHLDLARGEVDAAHQGALEAVRLAPETARARYALARTLEAQGALPEAARMYERALPLARDGDPRMVAPIQKDADALRARLAKEAEETGQAPAAPPPDRAREPAPWSVRLDAATHGARALLWLETQRAAPDGVAVMGGDLWVDPAGPALGVVASVTGPIPGPGVAALTGVEPDASGTRSLAWTDRLSGASLVTGFTFLVRTTGGQLFKGQVDRRGDGVLELTFTQP